MDKLTADRWAGWLQNMGVYPVMVRMLANGGGCVLEIGRRTLNSERECDIYLGGLRTAMTGELS